MRYEFNGRIRYSETGEDGRLTLGGLVNYFQDTSTFHSEELGVGLSYLKERKMAWILSSWQIITAHWPKLCQRVRVQTWPYEMKGFYGLRNFALYEEDGTMAAWANSVWVLMDIEQGRPVRVPPEITEQYDMEPKLEMEYASRKILLPEGSKREEAFVIGKQHLDTNHHVNNGQYIAMAEEYLPKGFEIHQMRADYRMQARLHDVVIPTICRQGNTVTVALRDMTDKPYAVVEFTE